MKSRQIFLATYSYAPKSKYIFPAAFSLAIQAHYKRRTVPPCRESARVGTVRTVLLTSDKIACSRILGTIPVVRRTSVLPKHLRRYAEQDQDQHRRARLIICLDIFFMGVSFLVWVCSADG